MPSSRPATSPRSTSLGTSLGRAAHAIFPRLHRSRRPPAHDARVDEPDTGHSPQPTAPRQGRRVTQIHNACRQLDADGLGIRRASSAIPPNAFSPFLLLDHCGPQRVSRVAEVRGEAPRCGQQELSYVVNGEMRYGDSCGNESVLRPGAVNLLTAGSGLVVSHALQGPVVEYFSIWMNLPREAMSAPPELRMTETPPCVITGKGESAAKICVLAGPARRDEIHLANVEAGRRSRGVDLETAAGRAAVYDVKMQRKAQLVLNPETKRAFVYVYRGSAIVGKKTVVREGDLAVLEAREELPVVIDGCGVHTETRPKPGCDFDNIDDFEEHACWCLVLAGDPVTNPVSMLSSGIVASTPQQMRKAFQDYTCGSMGASSPSSPSYSNKLDGTTTETQDEADDENMHGRRQDGDQQSVESDIPDLGFGKLEI